MCPYYKRFTPFLLLLAALTTSGCAALLVGAAAGAGGIAYVQGDLEKIFDYPIAKVHKASQRALKSLKAFVETDELNQHSAKIKFEFDDGKKGEINITALTERTTKLTVRVGIFGDETKSHMVLNAVLKKL